jgi:hypothetical protein
MHLVLHTLKSWHEHQLTATVPGQYWCGFLNPTADGADAIAAFLANCFSEALLPVDFFAVCLVLPIMKVLLFYQWCWEYVMMKVVVLKCVHIGFFWCQPVQSLWCILGIMYTMMVIFFKALYVCTTLSMNISGFCPARTCTIFLVAKVTGLKNFLIYIYQNIVETVKSEILI